jgi:pimeloyl-ACP methyl ester carboxylesterase
VHLLLYRNMPWARVPAGPMPEFKWLNWVNSEQYEPTISNLGSTVLSVMKRIGIERADYIDETWVRAYSSAFPNLAECRGAIQFPRNISERTAFEFLQELYENYSIEKLQAIPAMCVVGDEDHTTPADIRVFSFQSMWPNGPVVRLPGVGPGVPVHPDQ